LGLISVGVTAGLLCLVLMVAALAVVVPFVTGSQSYSILTKSMEPTYPPGTLVVVRPVDPANLRVGSVVTFQVSSGDDTVITHRIIGVTVNSGGSRSFTTMGDNNAVADDTTVRPEQIRGEVWYALPWLGAVAALRAQGAFGALIPILGGLLLLIGAFYVITWIIERLRHPHPQSG